MDRVEAVVAGGLAVAFLARAPLAAIAAGHVAYSVGSGNAQSQQATWRQMSAVLAVTAPTSGFRQYQATVQVDQGPLSPRSYGGARPATACRPGIEPCRNNPAAYD